jgi:hypothetical protein
MTFTDWFGVKPISKSSFSIWNTKQWLSSQIMNYLVSCNSIMTFSKTQFIFGTTIPWLSLSACILPLMVKLHQAIQFPIVVTNFLDRGCPQHHTHLIEYHHPNLPGYFSQHQDYWIRKYKTYVQSMASLIQSLTDWYSTTSASGKNPTVSNLPFLRIANLF